jgi:hypothetical protein
MISGASLPDPYLLNDSGGLYWTTTLTYRSTAARNPRTVTINPALKTLVLFGAGQSLGTSVGPTLYTATNAANIHNLNVYDGQFYDPAGPLLGCSFANIAPLGPGNVFLRIADKFFPAFDQVLLVPLSIGNTGIAQWATGIHYDRVAVAMRRLAARGITPGMTGVTFALVLMDGHRDYADGVTQSAWAALGTTFIANTFATGFNGRIFVCQESEAGQASNAVRLAQASLWNSVTVWDGGDIDNNGITWSDFVHPDDPGSATMATVVYNKMHASGAPL